MRRPTRWTFLFAATGIVAATFGMAVAHLVASLLNPQSSPVLAVGSAVIDATPTPVKTWAIENFGTNDKPILIGSVLGGTLVLAAVAGVIARRHLRAGITMTFLLVLLAGAAVLNRPQVGFRDVVPALVAASLGPVTLWWLVRGLRGLEGTATATGEEAGPGSPASRRRFLIGSGALLLGGAAAAGAGQWITRARSSLANIALPRPVVPLPALPAGLEKTYPGITPLVTSNSGFYRVDTKLSVPIVDHNDWSLTIDGMVENELTFTYDDLLEMDLQDFDIAMTCVSNDVGGKYLGAARWRGVLLKPLLERAGVQAGADQLIGTDVDGFTIGTPMQVVLDGRDAILAVGMNGEVLPRTHGFPARTVIPGLYGYVSATKWLTRLTATTFEDTTSYWTERGWATDGPIKMSSRIDTPKGLSAIDAGKTVIGGIAWAQHTGIEGVEVRIDGGAWQRAELGPDVGVDYWRQWYLPWDATSGSHQVAARALGKDGSVQTAVRAATFPDGSSGIQEVLITVA